jgi:hypothetical protein
MREKAVLRNFFFFFFFLGNKAIHKKQKNQQQQSPQERGEGRGGSFPLQMEIELGRD